MCLIIVVKCIFSRVFVTEEILEKKLIQIIPIDFKQEPT